MDTTTFEYDDNRLIQEVNAMGYTSTFGYDGDGNMISELDAANRLQTFGYNAFGQETSNVWYNAADDEVASIAFGYDNNGNTTLATRYDGTIDGGGSFSPTFTTEYTMDYNPLNQVEFVTETIGDSSPVVLTMGYDTMGERILLQDYSLGGSIGSVYDPDQELVTESYSQSTSGTGMQIQQQYDWEGRVSQESFFADPSGTSLIATAKYQYNASGQVAELDEYHTSVASSVIADYTLAYDGAQELTQEIDNDPSNTTTPTMTTEYGYDALGELTTYGPSGGTTTTQNYNAAGNRSADTVTTGNEVTYDGTYDLQYDQEGNETLKYDGDTTWTYNYDNQNHMTQVVESGSATQTVTYRYNAFGNMVEEDVTTWSGGTPTITGVKYVIDNWNPAKSGATGFRAVTCLLTSMPAAVL